MQITCAKKLIGGIEPPFSFGSVAASIHFSGLRVYAVKVRLEMAEEREGVVLERMDENVQRRKSELRRLN